MSDIDCDWASSFVISSVLCFSDASQSCKLRLALQFAVVNVHSSLIFTFRDKKKQFTVWLVLVQAIDHTQI